jgi:hypothetical protein
MERTCRPRTLSVEPCTSRYRSGTDAWRDVVGKAPGPPESGQSGEAGGRKWVGPVGIPRATVDA